ncbi:ABC transporter permease [Bariatricus massiliensis]|uniref:Transport permease protein n=1 Tax=Bariatricus massiliensis TaxID=1745713 RepID=A0ABS8DLK6_9FIRM|nr:ABC transporter permease [Bariatricus massiliensis]MCB7306141.1 ABC transporter permease [Bariatricus massiliensis]MCB7376650.1 ABC transporter permease [Bariatricus massiliensis]MCB7389308.1 ABC transporter permease [Bariatricus massiliensis]MCB7413505.1 ABC transporter permease [Bariatricus massiliensis]MCQ5254324.1 ABC transporter permease [Bariatricus massiliensis]
MVRVIGATYKKNRIGIIRAMPWSFIVSRVVTGVTQIVFPFFIYHYFLAGNLNADFGVYTGGADYITYIVLGAALNVLAVSTLMNVGRALITELREGTLEVLLLSPASRTGYFLGCLGEQTMRALLEFGTVLAVGGIFGADLRQTFTLQFVLVILLAILGFFCMGLSLSAVMLEARDTYITQNTLFFLMSLTCGIAFPIQYLPQWVQSFAQIFPLTPAVELFRRVMIHGQGIGENVELLAQLLILSVIYAVIGIVWFRRKERILIERIFG